jgi:cytochrome c oxidase subunit III
MSMAIPYTAEPRQDTGLTNVKIGMWLFLASEVMLFGGLFASYIILRVGDPAWPHGAVFGLSVPIAFVNTLVLILSSYTMVMAWTSLLRDNFSRFRLYQGITVLCGLTFLLIKAYEYNEKFHHGHYPSEHNFLAIYFTLTGLHGLHVLGGALFNAYLWGPGSKMLQTSRQQFINRVEVSGLFWHFVDLVWIFLFPVLYLL